MYHKVAAAIFALWAMPAMATLAQAQPVSEGSQKPPIKDADSVTCISRWGGLGESRDANVLDVAIVNLQDKVGSEVKSTSYLTWLAGLRGNPRKPGSISAAWQIQTVESYLNNGQGKSSGEPLRYGDVVFIFNKTPNAGFLGMTDIDAVTPGQKMVFTTPDRDRYGEGNSSRWFLRARNKGGHVDRRFKYLTEDGVINFDDPVYFESVAFPGYFLVPGITCRDYKYADLAKHSGQWVVQASTDIPDDDVKAHLGNYSYWSLHESPLTGDQDLTNPSIARDASPRLALSNSSFEEPRGKQGGFTFVKTMPGWETTDEEFEIWSTGFEGLEAHDGTQFVELNANIDGTLYQDLTDIRRGAALDFTFAHRGRNGDDTMKLTITDLGPDNAIGNDDDAVLFVKEYTTGKDAWAVYDSTTEDVIQAMGNTVRFAYTAVHGTGGKGPDKTEGNFLDSVNFGIEVANRPTRSFTLEQARQVLIGKWKANLEETETRYGELDAVLHRLVGNGFVLEFTPDSLELFESDGVMASYPSYDLEEADDGHIRVTTRQDGEEEVEDLRIIDANHIVLTSDGSRSSVVFDRYFELEGNATVPAEKAPPVKVVVVGDAETESGEDEEHIVTRDSEDQSGALWTKHRFSFEESFTITADIYLGDNDDGADGMALVFQSTGNDVKSTGSGIGYQGIEPSIAIEFDTYQNRDECHDPVEDHVGLRTNGDPIHTDSDFVEVGNLEDGRYHSIRFEWNADKQTFDLSLDGKPVFTNRAIQGNALAGRNVYFGFTAATGLYSNLHKVRSISFSKRQTVIGRLAAETTWAGNFKWVADPERGVEPHAKPAKLVLLDGNRVRYWYADQLFGDFELERDNSDLNAAWITLGDGNRIRFQWIDTREVLAEFWYKDDDVTAQPARTTAFLSTANHPSSDYSLAEAGQMLIGTWKANLLKTEARYGELDFQLHQFVADGFFLDFSSNGLEVRRGFRQIASSPSYQVTGPTLNHHFQVTVQQDGVEHIEELQFLDDNHMVMKAHDGGSPIVFDRYVQPEDSIARVRKTSVKIVTAGDSETKHGDVDEHIVTADSEDQNGAVWTEHEIDFTENFRISADIYLGTKDDGADGMALVFQSEGNDIVSTGSGIGYQGLSPSIAIEFDTYQNRDECNDPLGDHVAFRTNGSPVHTDSDYVEVGNLEDGKYHPLTLEWNADRQTFSLSLDGTLLFNDKHVPENGLEEKRAYFGFTAATGLYSNLHKVRRISLSKPKQ